MVLFNRFGLSPLAVAGTGLESVFQAAEDAAAQLANGAAAAGVIPGRRVDTTTASFERTEEGARLELIVPGFGPDDIELSIKRDAISVRGERGAEGEARHTFTRTFRTGFPIDVDRVEAKVEHGILTADLPRHESEAPRVVKIQGQSDQPRRIEARDADVASDQDDA